jgi:hypothetical protein
MGNVRVTGTIIHVLILVTLFFLCAKIGWASEDSKKSEKPRNRFAIGVAGGAMRFDTNFKFTNKDSGFSVFVDGEGNIGLPESNYVPGLYGFFRISKHHGIGFSYFGIKREATLLQFNRSRDFHLGDLTIAAGANAKITLTDESSFYYLSYNYTVFDKKQSFLFLSFGLYGLDLAYSLDARGEITLLGTPVSERSYNAEASIFAPLPMFGIDAWYFFTPKWALGTKVSLVGGIYQDVSALVLDTTVRLKFQFSKTVGASCGITYFNAEVNIDEEDLKTEVDYGYDGILLGLDIRF